MWWSLPQFQEDNWPTLLINFFWIIVSKCHPYIYLHFNSTVANTNNIPCDHRFIEALVKLWEGNEKKKSKTEGDNNIGFNSAFNAKSRLFVNTVFRIGLMVVW